MSDSTVQANRAVWEAASQKHVREHESLLAEARSGPALTDAEYELLAPILRRRPTVVHLQSGQGLDDIALTNAGAARVVGVDYSTVAASSAGRRADELGLPCAYVVAQLPPAPLRDGCADLVYTGKGALIWMPDLQAWADEVHRLLAPEGQLFVHEAHPMVPLYGWDADVARLRADRGYFNRQHVNDSFPARGAVEWQWTLGEVVTAVVRAGLQLVELREHPEPFWRPGDVEAAAWNGQLPNTFSLLAQRPPAMILPEVHDPRLITIRRGGSLTDAHHHLLALWAATCAEHVLPLFEDAVPDDLRPRQAVGAARAWVRGELPVMTTRAYGGHAMGAARPRRGAARFAAYAAGQAACVAHVPEHDLGAAAYALKAVRAAAAPAQSDRAARLECAWQQAQLPVAVRDLVLEDQRRRNAICWSVFTFGSEPPAGGDA